MQVSDCPRACSEEGRGRVAHPTPRAVFRELSWPQQWLWRGMWGWTSACNNQELPLEKWAALPVFFAANALLSVSRCRILAELAMMLWFVVGALFPALLLAAPPPINKLALFPDKSAWCEAKNITQIVGHSGCESKSIQNR